MTLAPGTELGHYEIVSPLGAGGMGEVYRARDPRLGREVAIKVLSADRGSAADQRRFEQEARAVALLSHPNILAIHEFDQDGGVSFAVTELLDGETLAERMARSTLPWREAVRIAAAICDGLAAAHAKGVIHRDLKPSNVFITTDGHVKILDFGLARMPASSRDSTTALRTEPGIVMGTVGYMSPEQLRGERAGEATDIFALGCILYEMVAGSSPFARPTVSEINAAILRDDPPALRKEDAPPALNRVIRRCLEKEPALRYHSARDLALDLRSLPPSAARREIPRALIAAGAAIAIALVVATLFVRFRRAAPNPATRSVLVMPFENETRDDATDYLSDGIAEGLIGSLAQLPNLRVIARTTAFQFKGKPVDLARMRADLGVDAVVSGKLLLRGNSIVVQADLIDTAAGTELWGERFHEQAADVMNVEQTIVGRISDALRLHLTPAQQTRVARAATRNPEAYRLYLQGRYQWNKRSPDGVKRSIGLFEQAVALDPRYALAYAGLADAYNVAGGYAYMPGATATTLAEQAARTALRLDPELAEAHAAMGHFEANRFHWRAAEQEFKKALALNPNYVSTHQRYAVVLLSEGRVDEAYDLIRRAEQIDPLSVLLIINEIAQLDVKGDYRGALAASRRALELDPSYAWLYLQMGGAYEGLGELENAAATYEKGAAFPGPPGFHEFFLARAAAMRGDRARARSIAEAAERRVASGGVSPAVMAWLYAAAGDRDRSIAWFERAFAVRDKQMCGTILAPIVRELRGDPRYDALVRRFERGYDD